MIKFFDLNKEYMEFNLGRIKELTKSGIKNVDEHTKIHSLIFDEAKKSFENK